MMRVFRSSKQRTPTMQELRDFLDDLPTHEVKPRRPHRGPANEWDDCDDCLELASLAVDVNREAQMSPKEQAEVFRAQFAKLKATLGLD